MEPLLVNDTGYLADITCLPHKRQGTSEIYGDFRSVITGSTGTVTRLGIAVLHTSSIVPGSNYGKKKRGF